MTFKYTEGLNMRLVITTTGKDLEALVDPRFGRCEYFIFVDVDNMDFEVLANESAMATGGAGIQAAQTVVEKNIDAVITGHLGPNAYQILTASNIKLFTGASGTVRNSVEKYQKGELKETTSPTTGSHSGMGGQGRGSSGSNRGRGGKYSVR